MTLTVTDLRPDHLAEDWAVLVEHVTARGSDLVLLPELALAPWLAARRTPDPAAWAASVQAHEDFLRERLDDLGGAAVLGTAPVLRDGRRRNEAWVANLDGRRGAHEKFHLPDEEQFWEASWYERGPGEFRAVQAGAARVGFLICTELWFFDHARGYGEDGVELLAVPRCTPASSPEKWLAGGRAAAVVAGAFCLSANHGGAGFGGRGWIVDPEGEVLATTCPERPVVSVEVDLDVATAAKRTYPRYVAR